MPDYSRVVGKFFTHQKTDGVPVPLQGRVFFTPVTSAYGEGTVYGAVERTGYVVDGVLCEDKAGATPGLSLLAPGEGVQPSAWSYHVAFSLIDEDGDRACLQPFYLEAKAGEEIDLATVSPVPDPVTGEWMLRGDRGEKGDPGRDGVSYTGIDLVGEELVFHRSDGEDQRVPAPRGKDGEPGRDGVDGAPGKDGVSPPAPNLTVGEVSEGEASASVTGSYPDLKLNLAIPRGATGPKGDTGSAGPKGDAGDIGPRGERGETGPKGADAEPLNLAVIASTLAPGTEATAQLSGDYPNLTLALGLPAGAKGDDGKSATAQDTGWRDIKSLLAPPSEDTRNSMQKCFVRRIGQTVCINLMCTMTSGAWKLSTVLPGFEHIYPIVRATPGVNTAEVYIKGKDFLIIGGNTNGASTNFICWEYTTADPFPEILPGTPA